MHFYYRCSSPNLLVTIIPDHWQSSSSWLSINSRPVVRNIWILMHSSLTWSFAIYLPLKELQKSLLYNLSTMTLINATHLSQRTSPLYYRRLAPCHIVKQVIFQAFLEDCRVSIWKRSDETMAQVFDNRMLSELVVAF